MSGSKQLCRRVGRDGPEVPAVGLGMMGFSIAYGSVPSTEDRLAFLDRAWSLGATNWDTADAYGDCEEVIGEWFKRHPERRGDIFLATKFGLKPDESGPLGLTPDSSPEYCRSAIQKSLKRLNTTYIDLYYVHRVTPSVPIEETMLLLKDLQRDGVIKHIGLSEVAGSTIRRAHAIAPVAAVQMEYNPWCLEIESDVSQFVKKVCDELGIAIFCYSPLGKGLMTGRYRSPGEFEESDARRHMQRFKGPNFDNNLLVADEFARLAKIKGCSPAQLVLAWVMAQGNNVFVIPGTKTPKYLQENLEASSVSLSDKEVKDMRELIQTHQVVGDRDNFWSTYGETAEYKGKSV